MRVQSREMVFVALMLAALGACVGSPRMIPVEDMPPGIRGIWRSNGYGYLLDASGDYPRLFHFTDAFCIEDAAMASLLSRYLTSDSLSFSSGGDVAYFSPTLEDYPIELVSIELRPDACGRELFADPLTSFESLVSYLSTHYPFFDLYGLDWKTHSADMRRRITPQMTDAALFDAMSALLKPLRDGHITLSAKVAGKQQSFEPGKSTVGHSLARMAARSDTALRRLNNKLLQHYWLTEVRDEILSGAGEMAANDMLQFGMLRDQVGYLAIAAEGGYADKGEGFEADDLAVLDEALSKAIALFNAEAAKTVIIDLSVNFGGYDFAAREIAGRFAAQRSLAYSKYAADSDLQTPFEVYIEPHGGERYLGKVIVVTSNVTVSAGEMLTMGLRALPNVTHVGEPTRGALSDVLSKRLSNGWMVDLSNEVYLDHEGVFWEGRGIKPNVPMTIFDPDNPFEGHVEAIRAIAAKDW